MERGYLRYARKILSPFVGIATVCSFMIAPAFANAADTPEWAVDEEQDTVLAAQADIPQQYDLRKDGLVTPVKLQNPWGSCWAFGAIAAAESSILSAYGSTYTDSKLNLSERHLAYFAYQPVTEEINPDQQGEGLLTLSTDKNAAFDAGGGQVYVTTLFSQGVGPLAESGFPYRGKDALKTLDYINAHPRESAKDELIKELGSEEAYNEYIAKEKAKTGKTEDQILDTVADLLRNNATKAPTYSDKDDWTIPATDSEGRSNRLLTGGLVLKDGNVMPEYWTDAEKTVMSNACVTDMKQEMLNGRGISVAYRADQTKKYTNSSDKKGDGFAQYCFDPLKLNHVVCIVGWDDNYDRSNFTHEVKNPDGSVDDEATAKTTPPANGAWIVKNSWGSETDGDQVDDLGNAMQKGTFGIKDENGKATGYFYLSYYDKTITNVETMDFSANLTDSSFMTIQHDYMPAMAGFYKSPAAESTMSSANVFTTDEAIDVKSVSTRTSEENMRVTFAIYKLKDDAKNPTDGELVYRTSENFQYGGFHRLDLDRTVTFNAGQRFSVVSTASVVGADGKRKYSVSANQGLSKSYAQKVGAKGYNVAVVNKGESYLYENGKWQDWSEYLATQTINDGEAKGKLADYFPVDNFSIKVYATSAANPVTTKPMHRLYNPNSGEHFYTAEDAERDNLISLGWNDEGEGWMAPSVSNTPVYRLYNSIAGEHHYTMDVSERDNLVSLGWNDEGIGWYSDDAKTVTVYREYNPNAFANNHNYTTDKKEHDNLISLGWNDEGTAWFGTAPDAS